MAPATEAPERLDRMRMELRRGLLVLAVLAALRQEHYGYGLRKTLAAANLDVEEGTLYPLIRRLESQGLLTSEWRENNGRRKRYYRTSGEGSALLEALSDEWQTTNASLRALMGEKR